MSETRERDPVTRLVDHLFRHSAGEMIAALTRIFGVARIDLAEDVVQEALLEALRRWRYQGVPDNPGAWLVRVARNRALDALRRGAIQKSREEEIRRWAEDAERALRGDGASRTEEIRDDQLRMIFICCHDAVPREGRVALTLKTLGGFGVAEIARAFLVAEPTIAQRIVRAKQRIREQRIPFEVPSAREISRRLDSVLDVLYLMFNEGYAAHRGAELLRQDLVRESMRLSMLLLEQESTRRPKVHALLSLFFLQAARMPARQSEIGEILVLEEQDRRLWDRGMIAEGFRHLSLARGDDEVTGYHLEAGIASCHAAAPSFEATDWPRILGYYDLLVQRQRSPVIALNRAVAVAFARGFEEGLREIDRLGADPALAAYHLLPATQGELLLRSGRGAEAASCFRRALLTVGSDPERRFLTRKLAHCEPSGGAQ